MKASELRQSILQMAVQGKLVPQDLHDEPASELLARIQAEKAKLIKDGKVKKERPLPPITEDKIPYDLPEGWVWCRLGEISHFINGDRSSKYPSGADIKNSGIPFINSKNIISNKVDLASSQLQFITEKKFNSLNSGHLQDKDIVFVLRGSVGKFGVFIANENFSTGFINAQIVIIRLIDTRMIGYVLDCLKSSMFDSSKNKASSGSAVAQLSANNLSQIPIPLPPLLEQHRIVAKMDELMAMCDELEAAENELEALEEHFIEYLPKSILQMAVQGKSVPQDLHDEPASELLARIRAEKAKLIREGKIKKEKPLPPITEDEIPYDLPEGWVWCRLRDAHSIHRGITFPATVKYKEPMEGMVCCATTGSVQAIYNPAADVYVPNQYVKNEGQWLQKNDIIMSTANSRELVGKTCIWDGTEHKTFGGFLTVIRPESNLSPQYSYYAIQYLWKSGAFTSTATQTTNIANINNSILVETLFPLPPVAEQQRIVAKVNWLMSMYDELKIAKHAPVKQTKSSIVVFPNAVDTEGELDFVARGDGTTGLSKEAQQDADVLFGEG